MITNLLIKDKDSSSDKNKTTQAKGAAAILESVASSKSSLQSRLLRYWKELNLQRKVTIVALAIGVTPIAIVGGVAQHLATESLMRQIVTDQESTIFEIRQKISLIVNHLINDVTTMANSPLISDPGLGKVASKEQKIAYLDSYIEAHMQKYDSLAVFDRNGNFQFQSKSPKPLNPQANFGNREYFQRAITTQAPAVNTADIDLASGQNNVEIATPIKQKGTGEIIGVLVARMPLSHWHHIFQPSLLRGLEHKLIDSDGRIFAADEKDLIGKDPEVEFKGFPSLLKKVEAQIDNGEKPANAIESQILFDLNDGQEAVVSLAKIPEIPGILGSGWQLSISTPVEESLAPLRKLRLTLLLGISASTLFVGSLAALIAHRLTLPILSAVEAVKKIGRGDLNTRLEVRGDDEMAVLGTDINKMAQQLQSLVGQKETEALRAGLLKDLTLKLASAIDSQAVCQIAVEEIIPILKVDRAFIYRPKQGAQGEIMAEAVRYERVSRLETKGTQLSYLDQYLVDDNPDRVRVVDNIYQAELKLPDLRQLEVFEVKSELSAPLFVGQEFQGIFVVHQCDNLRTWKQAEIDFFAQIASQVMLAKERTDLLLEQKTAKEQLQKQALTLLMEVEPISRGDLTTRATVAEGEIGTLADSYNSTVENLRQIVAQVQKSVTQIATTTSNNGEIAHSLSERAAHQSEAIASALQQIQAMTESIQAVALHAELVEKAFQEVSKTVAVGNQGMDRTVEGIFAIRETVAETAKKVKRLGESSQKISKVVNLINSFADRTNLLALNASLEANRAGQEGQNFAIVAEEVQTMAKQSAEATTEIEKLVASIQLDTKEVVTAMELGTEQVVAGTKLVDETRQKLNQIADSSNLVGDRLKKITVETVQQSLASQEISETIAEVAQMATITSKDAIEVSSSTQELLNITDELQTSAKEFKV